MNALKCHVVTPTHIYQLNNATNMKFTKIFSSCIYYLFSIYLKIGTYKIFISADFSISCFFLGS